MNALEATTETFPETRPDSCGIEREGCLDRLRASRAVKATIGAAVLSSTMLLAACGKGEDTSTFQQESLDSREVIDDLGEIDEQPAVAEAEESQSSFAPETMEFDAANLGTDAEREATMETAALSFAKTTVEYWRSKEGDANVQDSFYSNEDI